MYIQYLITHRFNIYVRKKANLCTKYVDLHLLY